MPVPGKRKSPKDIALQWVEKGDPDGFSIDMYGFKGRGIKTLIGRDRGEFLLHYTGEKISGDEGERRERLWMHQRSLDPATFTTSKGSKNKKGERKVKKREECEGDDGDNNRNNPGINTLEQMANQLASGDIIDAPPESMHELNNAAKTMAMSEEPEKPENERTNHFYSYVKDPATFTTSKGSKNKKGERKVKKREECEGDDGDNNRNNPGINTLEQMANQLASGDIIDAPPESMHELNNAAKTMAMSEEPEKPENERTNHFYSYVKDPATFTTSKGSKNKKGERKVKKREECEGDDGDNNRNNPGINTLEQMANQLASGDIIDAPPEDPATFTTSKGSKNKKGERKVKKREECEGDDGDNNRNNPGINTLEQMANQLASGDIIDAPPEGSKNKKGERKVKKREECEGDDGDNNRNNPGINTLEQMANQLASGDIIDAPPESMHELNNAAKTMAMSEEPEKPENERTNHFYSYVKLPRRSMRRHCHSLGNCRRLMRRGTMTTKMKSSANTNDIRVKTASLHEVLIEVNWQGQIFLVDARTSSVRTLKNNDLFEVGGRTFRWNLLKDGVGTPDTVFSIGSSLTSPKSDAAAKAVNKSSHLATSHGFQRSLTQSGQSSCCEGSHVSWPMDPLTQTGHSQGSQSSQQDDRLTSQQLNDRSGKSVGSARSRGMSVRSRDSEVSVTSDVSVDSGVSKQPHISAASGVSVHSARSALSLGNRQFGGKAVKDLRHDSGVISKTQTQSDSKARGTILAGSEFGEYSYDRSSDDGISVSDILIKSTHENNEHSVIENRAKQAEKNGHSSSTMSKCLKTSNRVEIFNSSEPQKVKISQKHLKEIKSPYYDDSPRISVSYDCKRPSSLLEGKHSGRQMVSSDGQNSTDKDAVISVNDSDRKKTVGVKMKFTKGTDSQYNNQFEVQKEKKSAEKCFEDVDIAKAEQRCDFERKSQFHNASLQNASSDYKHPSTYQLPTSGKGHVNVIESDVHFVCTTKPPVEQHTNRKCLPGMADLSGGQQIPALLHDPEDSIQIISAHASGAVTYKPDFVDSECSIESDVSEDFPVLTDGK
ncbi:hypothetical protein MAR_022951, partial [Mya arenaria]